jgi:hypothetical protein
LVHLLSFFFDCIITVVFSIIQRCRRVHGSPCAPASSLRHGNKVLKTNGCRFNIKKMTLCLGPTGSGKTLLLKKLQNIENVDTTATSVPTVGTNMFTIKIDNEIYNIRELGGVMSPLWSKYFNGIQKIIYVVDASNLCQISAAGVLLYTIIAHPMLAQAKVS